MLSRADCLSADGMGIVWAAWLLGINVPERVTGIDLMESLLPRFEADGRSVFLLGARIGVLERLQERFSIRFPGLVIAGAHHGYDPDDAKLAEIVRISGADVLFVALPSPRKDAFVVDYGPETGCRFVMGVGGAFDVLAGDIKRAPVMLQRCGLEFAWRIAAAPGVMVPRYVRGLARFACVVTPAILRARRRLFYRVAGLAAVLIGAIWLVLSPVDASSQEVLSQQDMAIADTQATELMQFLTRQVSEDRTVEIDGIVDSLIAKLLAGDVAADEGNLMIEDFRAILRILDRVLMLTRMFVPGGTGSFLMELIVMKTVLRVVAMYPDPIVRDVMTEEYFPEISRRFFDGGYSVQTEVTAVADVPGSVTAPKAAEPFLPVRFSNHYAHWDPAATQSWNTTITEKWADTDQSDWIEQPSVSPR
ncbi:WecB/TagA/CpsF family glycosyltransferase [Thalassospira australica]|uniref:WecB/TagA/CpsF family glycosyltransferase n=1 Tax=Thalassospira australica TaxID=1528106 RepID=UPI00384CDD42